MAHGVEYLESFPSSVTSGITANDLVPLRVFVPTGAQGPVPVVLIAHYLGATDLKGETALAEDLNERGMGAAILTLPFHMERTPPGANSGSIALRADPEITKALMYQSEEDARRSFDFLATRPEFDSHRFGIAGISLGALVAALVYAVEPRVKVATFALGGVDFAQVIWHSSLVSIQKKILQRQGLTEEGLRTRFKPIEPLTYMSPDRAAKALVIQARFDTVMPKDATKALIAQLPNPQVVVIQTGHYGGIFVERKLLRTDADFFAAAFNDKPFVAPRHFDSPTLRIGGLLAYPQGVDIGAGIDLFHLDPAGNQFGSLFITPRGLRLFLGQSLGSGFAIGAVGSLQKIGAGLMWSIIL